MVTWASLLTKPIATAAASFSVLPALVNSSTVLTAFRLTSIAALSTPPSSTSTIASGRTMRALNAVSALSASSAVRAAFASAVIFPSVVSIRPAIEILDVRDLNARKLRLYFSSIFSGLIVAFVSASMLTFSAVIDPPFLTSTVAVLKLNADPASIFLTPAISIGSSLSMSISDVSEALILTVFALTLPFTTTFSASSFRFALPASRLPIVSVPSSLTIKFV